VKKRPNWIENDIHRTIRKKQIIDLRSKTR
jgi:hypothetical protein